MAQNPRYMKLLKSVEHLNDGSGDLEVLVSKELARNPFVSPAEMAEEVTEERAYTAWKASLQSHHTWEEEAA